MACGYGGIAAVWRATGLAQSTIGRGIKEVRLIEAGQMEAMEANRARRPGAGRPEATRRDPTLEGDLKKLVESTTRGDPESPLLWTCRSQRHLVAAVLEEGHRTSTKVVARLLEKMGYSLQGNAKVLEGAAQHPDRNAQFEHINDAVQEQLSCDSPAISVDTKKKENVGPYKNGGRELRRQGEPEPVLVHDFPDKELGKATPCGVYDIGKNEGWVNVGINHDTAEFSVESIRSWWSNMGRQRYPNAKSILITADCGGSNGYRLRLWKVELQKLSDEICLPISVCHLPPGTSKWNKVEHRLFSFITQNRRGKPLLTHQVIVNLIAGTRTDTGLTVQCRLDNRQYAKGRQVTDAELDACNITRDDFHGEWNYTIHPGPKPID
jgi:hypothetical protein